jgi:antitoxin component YwqK of YwqJK toxin-antitoxin module
MEAIILHPQNTEQLSVFKQLFKTMNVPFETSSDKDLVVGYAPNGKPLTAIAYKKEIQSRIDDVMSGTAVTYTSSEVLNRISKK